MLTVLYVFQFIIAFLLIFFIFLQKREETTSLLSSNAYNSMFKNMGVPSNPLVKITLIIGVLFFLNSILISAILLKKVKSPSKLIEKVEEYNASNSQKEIVAPKANTASPEKSENIKKDAGAVSKKTKEPVITKESKAKSSTESPKVPVGKTN